jgi:hypothetical protein
MADESPNQTGGLLSGRLPIIALGVLTLISLAAVCGLGYSLLRSPDADLPFLGEQEAVPTPFPESVAGTTGGTGAVPGGSSEAIVYGISDSTTISVTLDAPVSMTLGGRNFAVLPQTMTPDGSWSPGVDGDASAGWVFGSIINYIMALEPTADNSSLLQSLAPGSEIMLTMQSGAEFLFEVEGSERVPNTDTKIFNQLTPGMTLLLLNESGDERQVVNGRFVLTETASNSTGGVTQVALGEPAQLDGLQVTVSNATYLPNHPDAPPGFGFIVLDGVIQNAGATTVDVGTLQVVLVDDVGNQYVLNPVANRLGVNPPLTGGFLTAGQVLTFSVGYQVPLGLSSTTLTAKVVRRDTGAQVQIGVPFSGTNVAYEASVILQSVEVSEDLSTLILTGQITNNANQPLIVAREDVTLRTPDGASYLILSSNPPFPWTVPAGQTLLYVVSFQRPLNADTAVFTVLNQPFQLNRLR